ncbi:MAG: helix-turn-helix domain-containing protein, partial [Thermoplasmata archaeon]|nr:helix-turn-helix domain-containing protein [Thermoplasmata archaeon]
ITKAMQEIVLRLKVPDNWVKDITERHPVPIKFLECKPFGKAGGRSLIEIDRDDQQVDDMVEEMRAHPDICKINLFPYKDGRVLGTVTTSKCVACQLLTGSDCFLLSATSRSDGWVEWDLVSSTEDALSSLMKELEESGCSVRILKKAELDKNSLLTKRQEEVVRIAFEMGYYDHPRRMTLRELSKVFGISPSTLSEIMQRGERKIMRQYLARGMS